MEQVQIEANVACCNPSFSDGENLVACCNPSFAELEAGEALEVF